MRRGCMKICQDSVISRQKDMVYRLAYSQCHQKDKADDIFQEVMYRYMKKKPIFESFEHEKSWFIRVTLNCSKTFLMSFWNNKVEELHDEDIAVSINSHHLLDYLHKLPKKYNAVLYLFYYEDYSTKEIAHILHLKDNYVRVLLNRARQQLKEEMMKDEQSF